MAVESTKSNIPKVTKIGGWYLKVRTV